MSDFPTERMEQARQILEKSAMLHVAGMFGPELVGVEVPDEDCVRYLREQEQGIELDISSYLS